jgi:hypothetical protein
MFVIVHGSDLPQISQNDTEKSVKPEAKIK